MNKAKPIAGLVILALLGSGAWYLLHDRTTETREPTAWGARRHEKRVARL